MVVVALAWRNPNLNHPDDWQDALTENQVDPDTAKSMPGFAFEFHYPAHDQPITKKVISTPVAAYKHDNGEWLVGLRVGDFIALAKQAGAIKGIFCPHCGKSEVAKHTATIKSVLRYRCRNSQCAWFRKPFSVKNN